MSKKGLTELVMILDRSGSMGGLESDTIGGFNGMIEKQKKEEGEALVSVVLFDDRMDVIYDRVDIRKIEPMTDKQYYVRGTTALLDAVGRAVHHIKNVHKYIREEDVPEKTIFVITTDGLENASREYSYDAVKKLIEQQKEEKNWEFMFLGANIDAVKEAGRIGISASRAARYNADSAGTAKNFVVVEEAIGMARRAPSAKAMSAVFEEEDVLAEVRKEYEMRGTRK
ncbi:MAG: VWA domain-containing protein [Firmicutes bacterium]|nr:VWA domain-containing protein [Bacillota bacterium]